MRSLPAALASVALLIAIIALASSLGSSPGPGGETRAPDPRLEKQVEELEQEVRSLRADLTALELAVNTAEEARPAAELESRLDALEESIAPVLVARAPDGAGIDFERAVSEAEIDRTRRAIAAVRREELGTKIEGWIAKEQARSETVLEAIESKLSLPSATMRRVRNLFAEETEAHGAILDEMWSREPPQTREEEETIAADWDRATRQMKGIRRDRDAELVELLGEERFGELEAVVRAVEKGVGE